MTGAFSSADGLAPMLRPDLPYDNWPACLIAMEDFAIFSLRWEPARAAYAIQRLEEVHKGMDDRGELGAPLYERMADDAAWRLLDGFGDVFDGIGLVSMSTYEVIDAARTVEEEAAQLGQLREEIKAGMEALGANPARAAYVDKRLNELGMPEKRRLPIDHPDHVSAGAMFRLAMAYAEIWDQINEAF